MEYIGSAFWIIVVVVVFATMITNARKAAAQRDRTGGQPVRSLPQRVSHLREVQSRAVRTMADVTARPAAPPRPVVTPAVTAPAPPEVLTPAAVITAAAPPAAPIAPVAAPLMMAPIMQPETAPTAWPQFRDRAALVHGLIAAEVLGPPLSLRHD